MNPIRNLASPLLRTLPFVAAALMATPLPAQTAPMRTNPLLTESTLPFHYPRFDLIKEEDYMPAFEQGAADYLKEVEAIANNPEQPTFDNTIVALEKSGDLVDRVTTIFYNLNGCNTNPTMQAIARELGPKNSALEDKIHLNGKLFARIKTLHDAKDSLGLDAESAWLLERYYKDFVRAGANLAEPDKEKLKALNQKISKLQTKFTQNVLKEKNAESIVVDTKEELAGLSAEDLAATIATAKAEGKEGKYVIALQNTTTQPSLSSLQNRALRQKIMEVSLARNSHGGEFDNKAVVSDIAKARAERANLLGYPTHADYILDDQTAAHVSTVNSLLAQLAIPAVANAKREAAEIQKVIDAEHGGFQVQSWDWDFYSEKVRAAKYSFDGAQLKPYFEINHVLFDGVFYAAGRLYGLTFKERHDLPVYQPDVRVFDVFDKDGTQLAIFIGDYYARASKGGGAWMNEYIAQSGLKGYKAIVANHLNIPKPPEGQPTLLDFDNVTTMFHEFGHALHGMFSNVKYPRFSGTRVPRDFVEYPSQTNEMWAAWPEVVKNYAKHYQTGEPMPQELLTKMLAAKNFNQGYMTTEYLSATLLDQAWHQLPPEKIPTDTLGFEAEALHKAGVDFPPVPPRYRSTYFSHTFAGGYSAGYYSYIWAEVLVADSVDWFKAHGGLKRENGQHFRDTLLSRGGSDDAMVLFKNFSGGAPEVGPLLKRRGLDQASP